MRVLLALLLASTVAVAAARAAPARPWLWQCEQIANEDVKDRCYVRLLLLDVDRSGDPARELPRIDRRARAAGTSLEGRCHVLMHEVGRQWGREHHLTLSTLQQFVPRSSDPGCSAGFGMGLVMYLGPEIVFGGKRAVATCLALPTRYRSYTCVHGLGHALLRGYHGALAQAVAACVRLGPRVAPDCAQGAFHDYWISLRGADGTTRLVHGDASARSVCARYPALALPCWYRYFVEQPRGPLIRDARDMERVCRGLAGGQRAGCIAGTSLYLGEDPLAQTRMCARLGVADSVDCLRGVPVQAYMGDPRRQRALIRSCSELRAGARAGCYAWYGRTLAVITNGRFRCSAVAGRARAGCAAGARRIDAPVVTFS